MKTIVIPTDFTLDSLAVAYATLMKGKELNINIILLHILNVPYSMPEILYMTLRNGHHKMITKEFLEGCEIMQNRFKSRLHSLDIKFSLGDTKAYVKNLLEAEGADEIHFSETIKLTKPSRKSIDMIPLLKSVGLPINNIKIDKDNVYSISPFSMLTVKSI